MRIATFSDLHLGVRQYGLEEREEDFYEQYNYIINRCIGADVDVVIIAGDIFDQPRPSPKALKVFSDGLRILENNNIVVLNVIGNHTMIQAPNFVTADEFIFNMSGFDNCMLLGYNMDEIFFHVQDYVGIFGLPFNFNYNMTMFKNDIAMLGKYAKSMNNKKNILVLHQAFKEYCGFTGEELSIYDIDTSAFDLIICGHIHERKLANIDENTIFLQPGSIERLSVAEARDEENQGKGLYIFDTDDMSIESIANGFCKVENRRKFLIADMYTNTAEDIDSIRTEIITETKNLEFPPVLFLTVHDVTNSFHQLIDLTKDLKEFCLTVHFNYFDENIQFETENIEGGEELPNAREALKIALNPLDEEQRNLGLDLFDLLKDGKDAKGLLDDYYQKNYKKEVEIQEKIEDQELKELEEYFENL